jgi:hypothetical protein
MKVKVSELQGAALDWAVAKCKGMVPNTPFIAANKEYTFKPSTDWAQGGPIIEREKLCITASVEGDWTAFCVSDEMDMQWICRGPTPLIAAMRCYVASQMGDEIELPEELR